MVKIGIIGSRRRDTNEDYQVVRDVFLKLWDRLTPDDLYMAGIDIISGGCSSGADRFAEMIAREFGFSITIHYPSWKIYGKQAAAFRNWEIALDSETGR